jgi:conserved domain protein
VPAIGGNRYLAGIDQNPVTHGIESVELRELFNGDTFEGIALGEMSAQEFAGELVKIGSVPIMEIEMVWWPVERVSFFLYEDVPSAIGWWGKDLTNDELKAIFSGRIEDLDPNVYHFYKP